MAGQREELREGNRRGDAAIASTVPGAGMPVFGVGLQLRLRAGVSSRTGQVRRQPETSNDHGDFGQRVLVEVTGCRDGCRGPCAARACRRGGGSRNFVRRAVARFRRS